MAFYFPLGGWFLGGGPTSTGDGYRVYANDGAGGPVDYTTPIGDTTGLTFDVGPLDYGSDWTFAVRAYMGSLEERNVDARVRVLVSAAGVDLASLPNAPSNLSALAGPGGTATVSWVYNPRGQGAAPTNFHVYRGTPTVSYGSPVATVAYSPTAQVFSATLSGLTGGSTYQVAVRAYNATGEEANTSVATFVASTLGPKAPIDLAATVIS